MKIHIYLLFISFVTSTHASQTCESQPLRPQNEKVPLLLNKMSPNALLQHNPAHNVGYCYHFEMATVTTKKNSIG